jgi:GAF domain-containing protein
MARWWQSGRETARQREFESHQQRLERLSGQMLERYRAGLKDKVADPDRLQALYGTHFLDGSFRQQAHRVLTMACSMLRVPNAMVNIVTPLGQQTVAAVGANDDANGPLETHSFCQHVIGTGRELAVSDAEGHSLVCDTVFARDGIIVSYLGVPIVRQDWIVGVLCVYDDKPRDWDTADVGMLTQLSQVLSQVS